MALWIISLFSGITAGLAAILVTFLIERFGGAIGGVLGTSPSTIVPTFIGIALVAFGSEGVDAPTAFEEIKTAVWAIAPGMAINVVFLLVWRELPPHLPRRISESMATRLSVLVATSLLVWLVLATLLVITLEQVAWFSVPLSVIALLFMPALGIFLSVYKPLSTPPGSNPVTLFIYALRGSAAGVAIVVSVFLSAVNKTLGGVAAVFPAIFLTTMVSLAISQPAAVGVGAIGPMMLGCTSVPVYAIVYSQLLPPFYSQLQQSLGWAIALSCACAYVLAVLCVSLPVSFFFRWMASRSPPPALNETEYLQLDEEEGEADDEDHPQSSSRDLDSLSEDEPSVLAVDREET